MLCHVALHLGLCSRADVQDGPVVGFNFHVHKVLDAHEADVLCVQPFIADVEDRQGDLRGRREESGSREELCREKIGVKLPVVV
jgi:hypothetical protein